MKKAAQFLRSNYILIFALVFAIVPLVLRNNYYIYVMNRGFANAIAVLGLVILYGIGGQISLGHVAFFAIGAYTSAILSLTYNVPVYFSILIGIFFSCLFGVLLSIPAFKLSGPFLAISTVAFGEIIRIIILNAESLTGGPYGLNKIPDLSLFGITVKEDIHWYYLLLLVAVLFAIIGIRLKRSHIGRALYAIKDDEIAAEVMGVNIRSMKRLAFVNAAFFAGTSGALYAHFSGFLGAELVAQDVSFNLFSMAVLGGTDSIVGGVWSGMVLTIAPEAMRFLQEYYIMILNLLVLLVVLVPWTKVIDSVKEKYSAKSKVV